MKGTKCAVSDVDAVRKMYNDTAADYASMMDTEMADPSYKDVLERLSRRIAVLPGTVIDTSCGSGHMLEMYHRLDPDRMLVGLDIAPRMIELASTRLPAEANIFAGDMCRVDGIADGSAAAVISYFALHHLDEGDIDAAFSEWRRWLVPGGRLVVASWTGDGKIDYHGESDIVAMLYPADMLKSKLVRCGFSELQAKTRVFEEMSMDAVYIECTRGDGP